MGPVATAAHRLGQLAVLSLPAGVLVSVATTRDPDWWGLYFSQLGAFADFSGRMFNTTAVFSGFFLAAYGVFIVLALPPTTRRRSARAFRAAIVSAGLHLMAVGLVPIPVSAVMHDIIASGLGLSFLAIVVTGLALPGHSRRFRRATRFCVALLATGMAVLTAGLITLALYEFVAFVAMGIWLLSLPRALARRAHADSPAVTSPPPTASCVRRNRRDGERMPRQNPWPTPSPSRSSVASIPLAPPKPRTGHRRAPTRPPAFRAPSAGSARGAARGTRCAVSAASRLARLGSSRRTARGGSTRGAPSPVRCASTAAPASRAGGMPRPRRTSRIGTAATRPPRQPGRSRSRCSLRRRPGATRMLRPWLDGPELRPI